MKYIIRYHSAVYENLKDAKEFMKQRVAAKMQTTVSELTPDQVELALTQPKFLEIQQMLANKQGYILAFTRFHFEHGAKIMGLPENGWTLEKLLKEITQKRWILDEISHPIDWFAAQEKVNGVNPFEALTDEIDGLFRNKEAKWIVNILPGSLREQFRQLPKTDQQRLFNQAHILKQLGQSTIARLVEKISAFGTWKISDVISYIIKFVTGYSNATVKDTIEKIDKLQPQVGILYMDEGYLVLSMRTETAQIELCSIANWCINRGSFRQYANNALQINIFNFNTDTDDPMFLTGTTINYLGKVTNSHDINDLNILSDSDITAHFSKLKYPNGLINSILKEFDSEVAIKKIVYELDLGKNSSPEKIFLKINQATNSFPEVPNQKALDSLFLIIQDSISGKIAKADLFSIYSKVGILNQVSALIFNKMSEMFSSSEVQQIIQTSINNFNRLDQIKEKSPHLLNNVALNILSQKDLVLDQLKKFNLDEVI